MLKAIWNAVRFILGADEAPKATPAPARPNPAPVGNSHPIGPEATAPAAATPTAVEKEPAKQSPAKKAKKAAKTPAKSKSKS